jgi:apolipoprotein N-acyltransferase
MKTNIIRFSIMAISIALAGLAGINMPANALWGYWPMLLFVSLWVLWLTLAFKRYELKKLGLATLSAVFLWLGFPDMPCTPLLFVAFVPLLIVERNLRIEHGRSLGQMLRYSYHTFLLWNVLSTFWVCSAAFVPGIIANMLNALFMCIPWLLFHSAPTWTIARKAFSQYGGQAIRLLLLISFWMTFEYIHLRWDLSWSWLNLGNAFASHPDWIQWYEFTGVFGGSLWIWMVNIFVFRLIEHYKLLQSEDTILSKELLLRAKGSLLGFIVISILPMIGSFMILAKRSVYHPNNPIHVAAVNPNYEPHFEKFSVPDAVQLQRILNLARPKVNADTRFLLLPETTFGLFNLNTIAQEPVMQNLHTFVDSFPKLNLITGLDAYKTYQPAADLPSSVRMTRIGLLEPYNLGAMLRSGETDLQYYKKSKLVPGAEFIPYPKIFSFLKPLFEKFGGSLAGFGKQAEVSVFTSKEGISVGPPICYESIFGEFCGGFVKKGAQFLAVYSNDGWWDNSPGYRQHLAFSSLRAIETRRYILRSANLGSCAIIDWYGHVFQATPYGVPAAISGSVYPNSEETFYVKYGDYIGFVAVCLSVLGLFFIFYENIKRK